MRPDGEISAGALRVLEAARDLAGVDDAWNALHLLHALWRDESRAAEFLAAAGLTTERLLATVPLAGGEEERAGSGEFDQQQLLHMAAMMAGRTDAREVGTEHLLWAVLDLQPQMRELLARCGVAADTLSQSAEADAQPPIEAPDVSFSSPAQRQADRHDPRRVLDAAANRCREGLRVLEDYVRYLDDDRRLTTELKTLRHRLRVALGFLGGERFWEARDTPNDVGTTVTTQSERHRAHPVDVLQANCKRVGESLRSLEEFGKLINPNASAVIESVRYRFYEIERQLLARSHRPSLTNCRLCLLVTESRCRLGLERTVKDALAGGVDMIQLREKKRPDRELLALAQQVRGWTQAAGALFIVNDRPDLAEIVGADGVHVGQDDMPIEAARHIGRQRTLVGVSTHELPQARAAVAVGADYLGVGPVYPSPTKSFGEFRGLEFVSHAAAEVTIPWFAIGGINASNIEDVVSAGATRAAVSSAICDSDSPESVSQEIAARLAPG